MLSNTPTSAMKTALTTGRAHRRDEKEGCIRPGPRPHLCSWICHEYPSHSGQISLLYYFSYPVHLMSAPDWVEKLICELGSCFSILWPLNKACAIPVSALVSLLPAQIHLRETAFLAKTKGLSRGSDPSMGPVHQSGSTQTNYEYIN